MSLLLDELVTAIAQAANSPEFDFPDDLQAQDFPIDPVERITAPAQPREMAVQPIEQPSPVDVMTTTPGEKKIAKQTFAGTTPGSAASFQAAQAITLPEPKNWFKTHGGGPNGDLSGFIPLDALSPIEKKSHFMRPDAAKAYKAMQRAMKKDLGFGFSITDSYRDYDAQVRLKGQKPSLAATPGRSNHGWGLALDINVNDSRVYEWLAKNGDKFGFDQPMSYEPWHWEYQGGAKIKVGGKAKPKAKPKRAVQTGDPLNRVSGVAPLISASLVFGSVAGEVNAPAVSKRRATTDAKTGGLGFVPARFRKMFKAAADKYGIPARLLAVMAQKESGFDPKAVSSAGAQGIMQVMPLHGLESPFNARANIFKGAEIFASYLDAANGNLRLALAYYNAGPNAAQNLLQARMKEYADPILAIFLGKEAA